MVRKMEMRSSWGLIITKTVVRVVAIVSVLSVLNLIPHPGNDKIYYYVFLVIWALSEIDWFRKGRNKKAD